MKKIIIILFSILGLASKINAKSFLYNEYSYLQDISFELYTDDVPAYKVPEQLKSIEEILMFDVLHATWKDKRWVSYTLNTNLLGNYKVGQPALADNGDTKKIFFVANFIGTNGGLDLYTADYKNATWSKPKNLGSVVNTSKNESNPGLLNENTLTYSSGGIIKKLNLKTFVVVDLEEAIDKPESTIITNNKVVESTVIKTNDAAETPVNTVETKVITKPNTATEQQVLVQKTEVQQTTKIPQNNNNTAVVNTTTTVTSSSANVQTLGVQSRERMLAKFKTAIQLGAFTTPKWEQIQPLAKFGKLVTYKNDNGANVVWITGFANRAAAENVLPQVKSVLGFEGAYVTGK